MFFTRFDIISIGDMGIDVFLEMAKEEVELRHEHQPDVQKICFNYADKIPVEKMTKTIAGNACNVAVGTRRLGLRTALVTIIGKDPEATMIAEQLWREKVDTRYITQDKRTNFSAVINYLGERTIFVYHEPRDYRLPKMPKAKFVYLTSMRPGWEEIVPDLTHYLERTGTKLAYNPGTYQLRAGPKFSQALLDHAEILFVNKEEAMLFAGTSDADDISALLTTLHRLGPRIVVITDGPKGSYASDASGQYELGIYDVPVIERTGCGDAYATGFMSALAAGHDIQEAMRWGSFESASVLQQIGPQAGLVSRQGLEALGQQYADFIATELKPGQTLDDWSYQPKNQPKTTSVTRRKRGLRGLKGASVL
jgi:ribokinase